METSESIKELTAALSKAQLAFLPVKETEKVDFQTRTGQRKTYSYAPLSAVLDSCRKALSDNGLAIMQMTKMAQKHLIPGEHLVLETLLAHISGEWVKSEICIEPITSDPQSIGSALTYARRYALSALLGISSEEDDDARKDEGTKSKGIDKREQPLAEVQTQSEDTLPSESDAPEPQKKPVKTGTNDNLPAESEQASKIDVIWLKETLQIIKWKESTALSWIKSQLKVSGTTLSEALSRLNQDELKTFVEHISVMREALGK